MFVVCLSNAEAPRQTPPGKTRDLRVRLRDGERRPGLLVLRHAREAVRRRGRHRDALRHQLLRREGQVLENAGVEVLVGQMRCLTIARVQHLEPTEVDTDSRNQSTFSEHGSQTK